jgi:hypothetical protein
MKLQELDYPAVYNGHEIKEMKGESLLSLFSDPDSIIHDEDYVFCHRAQGVCHAAQRRLENTEHQQALRSFKL